MTTMTPIYFHKGDDVPEWLERATEDNPLEYLRFGVDVQVTRDDAGRYVVRPMRSLSNSDAMMVGKGTHRDRECTIIGGPTVLDSRPVMEGPQV